MLTSYSVRIITLFTGLLLCGLLLGNVIIITASLSPLALLLIGLLMEPPAHSSFSAGRVRSPVWIGDEIDISWSVTMSRGLGIISLFQELPQSFTLVEGNNLRVLWKGWGPRTVLLSCKVRCAKRGIYTLPPLKWEARHVFGLSQTRQGVLGEGVGVVVRPKVLNLKQFRGVPGIATSPFPMIDMARIGVATTDFREIRSYVHGDPVKNINWKATARRAVQSEFWPLVNEYEVEGKKAIWLFLDASSVLEIGTDLQNAFEYCLEAANSVAYYFLDRGYRLGMYIFNDTGRLFYPETSKKQFLKISRELIGLEAGDGYDEFPKAVERCRSYIVGHNPACVVITRLDSGQGDAMLQGVRKLRQFRGRRRRRLPVMVLSVAGYHVASRRDQYDDNTALLLQLETRPLVQQLRRLGASVLEWNPRQEGFGTALLRQVKVR